jgi:hypothetical protein
VGRGEPFELGFGADDAVRVRRSVVEERDTVPLTGTQKVRRVVTLYLSNLSGDPKHVAVTERVPVSEIDDVEIVLLDAKGWRYDEADGFLRWPLDLGPRATERLTFAYEIRAAAKVDLG